MRQAWLLFVNISMVFQVCTVNFHPLAHCKRWTWLRLKSAVGFLSCSYFGKKNQTGCLLFLRCGRKRIALSAKDIYEVAPQRSSQGSSQTCPQLMLAASRLSFLFVFLICMLPQQRWLLMSTVICSQGLALVGSFNLGVIKYVTLHTWPQMFRLFSTQREHAQFSGDGSCNLVRVQKEDGLLFPADRKPRV